MPWTVDEQQAIDAMIKKAADLLQQFLVWLQAEELKTWRLLRENLSPTNDVSQQLEELLKPIGACEGSEGRGRLAGVEMQFVMMDAGRAAAWFLACCLDFIVCGPATPQSIQDELRNDLSAALTRCLGYDPKQAVRAVFKE